jgi:UDP-glucose 4-epimerase
MVHALVDAGEPVVVLDNLTTGFDWAVAKNASLVVGDAGDQPRVAALIAEHRVDAVIHFATCATTSTSQFNEGRGGRVIRSAPKFPTS